MTSFQNPSQDVIASCLKNAKTIAVVGLSYRENSPAYGVSKIMQEAGYTIIPVNPRLAGQKVLGETVYASLQDVPAHIDIVDIFRRSEFLLKLLKISLKRMLMSSGHNLDSKAKKLQIFYKLLDVIKSS